MKPGPDTKGVMREQILLDLTARTPWRDTSAFVGKLMHPM
jgi:hypothetical protein